MWLRRSNRRWKVVRFRPQRARLKLKSYASPQSTPSTIEQGNCSSEWARELRAYGIRSSIGTCLIFISCLVALGGLRNTKYETGRSWPLDATQSPKCMSRILAAFTRRRFLVRHGESSFNWLICQRPSPWLGGASEWLTSRHWLPQLSRPTFGQQPPAAQLLPRPAGLVLADCACWV